jgi:hypothetical protein
MSRISWRVEAGDDARMHGDHRVGGSPIGRRTCGKQPL